MIDFRERRVVLTRQVLEEGPTAVVDGLVRGPGAAPGWRIAAEADRTVAVARVGVAQPASIA